jgi:hypothetical protein
VAYVKPRRQPGVFPRHATTTGLPRSSALSRCSTDA